MRQNQTEDQDFLSAALRGYEVELARITAAMDSIRRRQTGRGSTPTTTNTQRPTEPARKRHISAEGRRAIAEAQRRRWAAKREAEGGKTMRAGGRTR